MAITIPSFWRLDREDSVSVTSTVSSVYISTWPKQRFREYCMLTLVLSDVSVC